MTKLLGHLKNNAVAYVALFVALGGTSYAAIKLPAGSVGNRQLKNHAVTPIKLDTGSIAGYVRDYAEVDAQGELVAARPKAHLAYWQTTGPAPGGQIVFDQPIPSACFALATTEGAPFATYASAQTSGEPRHDGAVLVSIPPPANTGSGFVAAVNVAVICPQP
jgi:hypothetical protein